MSAQLTEQEALSKVTNYCAAAEHCRAEVSDKLQRWGIAYETIARILNKLETEKYIDEERYCRAFVNDKFKFDKWGKRKIAQELHMKKIPSDVAWRHLNGIDDEEYLATLNGLIAKKRKSIHADNEYLQTQKLIRYAVSRGFELKDIRRCMEIPEEIDEEESK